LAVGTNLNNQKSLYVSLTKLHFRCRK